MHPVGRHDAIGAARDALRSGDGAALVVIGLPGSGVTEILRTAIDQAHGDFHKVVVAAAGHADETAVPLAVLRELAARDAGGRLAERLADVARDDLAAAAEALLSWAGDVGDDVAVVVDDLHLADPSSRTAIVHLARRVGLTSLAVIIGTHDATGPDGVPSIVLEPMTTEELLQLLADRADIADSGVARRIAEVAEGSPLVAVEVARALDDAQRRGAEPLPSFAVSATPIRHAFAHSIAALDHATREALCVAAAEPSGELRVVAAALQTLDRSLADLDAAEQAGIITLDDGAITFDHPIRRSVAYRQLAPASRRAAHRALAGALDAPRDAERRAAHLAAGVIEPDEALAADLELVAEAAERRRDHLEARRWWLAAARLSPSSDGAQRREGRAAPADATADPLAALTKAERRVAAVVGAGATNKGAAEKLYVSVKTVDAHLQSIYRKLGIGSRAELAVLVTQADLTGAPAAG